jgi:DNA-binding CsgD family transcriptional regulator
MTKIPLSRDSTRRTGCQSEPGMTGKRRRVSHGNAYLQTASALSLARNRASHWQQGLADTLEAATGPDVAGVFLCPLGNVLDAAVAMAPRRYVPLGQCLVDEIFPRWIRDGVIRLRGPFETDRERLRQHVRALRSEFLEPAGFQDLALEFLRTEDGEIAGWISIFGRSPGENERARVFLSEIREKAQEAVRASLAIAVALGVRLPKLSPMGLSNRERQVAELAASGLTDLNIARRLDISEGTVGRHLHNIFGKLGVRSRQQLGDLSVTSRARRPSAA